MLYTGGPKTMPTPNTLDFEGGRFVKCDLANLLG